LRLQGVPTYNLTNYSNTSSLVVLFLLAYAATSFLACLAHRDRPYGNLPAAITYIPRGLQQALLLGALASVILALLVLLDAEGPYGYGYATRDFKFYAATLTNTAVLPLFIAVYYFSPRVPYYNRQIHPITHALVVLWALLNLAAGDRSPVLAVGLAWLVSRPSPSRIFRPTRVLALLASLAIALTAVGTLRAVTPEGRGEPLLQMFVGSTSGAPNIASWVVAWEDGHFGTKYGGRTFLGSAASIVPGLTIKPHDGPLEFQLRYEGRTTRNEARGYGYSLLAEGYLNWGVAGAAIIGVGLGGAMTLLWAQAMLGRRVVASFVYVYFLVSTPYALRTDSFGAFKLWAYGSVTLLSIAWLLNRVRSRDPGEAAGGCTI
jgi:oligosaccharide repeat unit polymerase